MIPASEQGAVELAAMLEGHGPAWLWWAVANLIPARLMTRRAQPTRSV